MKFNNTNILIKFISKSVFLTLFLNQVTTTVFADEGVQTVAVVSSQIPNARVRNDLTPQVVDSVINVLRKFKRFNLVERTQMNQVMQEFKFQNSGAVEDNSAVSFGKQTGANLVALVNYNSSSARDGRDYEMSLNVNLKFVDVKTGSIVLTKQIRATSGFRDSVQLVASSLTDFERKLERELTIDFPNEGYVIKVISAQELVLDLGKNTGVTVNDEFVVFTEGEDIIHPVTKKIIKGEKLILSEGIIVSVSTDTSVMRISNLKGSPPQVGAKVQSKPKKKGFLESLEDLSR